MKDYHIQYYPMYRLKKVPIKNLKRLRIVHCKIATIDADAFEYVADTFEELDLTGNTLSTIPDFNYLPKLKKLVVSKNQITLQQNESNVDVLNIENLKISNNGIVELTKSSLSQFKNLKVLDISYNPNIKILPDAFSSLKLESLTMNVNGIKTLPVEAINSMPSLTTLSLDNNLLTELPPNAFAALKNLTSLSLQSNQLMTLPVGVFNGLKNLKKLSLNHNCISHLSAEVFSGLDQLEELDVSFNSLTKLQTGLFTNLDSLTNLELGVNQIDEISQNALPPLEKASIGLRVNKLTTLNITSFVPLENSSEVRKYNCEDTFRIDLDGNPIKCDDKLAWIFDSYLDVPVREELNIHTWFSAVQAIMSVHPTREEAMRLIGSLQPTTPAPVKPPNHNFRTPLCETPRRYNGVNIRRVKLDNGCYKTSNSSTALLPKKGFAIFKGKRPRIDQSAYELLGVV